MRSLATSLALTSFALLLYELLLTRLFAVVLFADFAHLALALALLGIGIGAMAMHLRPSLVPAVGIERRLGALALLQALLTLLAVLAAIRFPVLRELETPPVSYQDRAGLRDDLLDPVWFVALLPALAAPFAVAGLAFAGAFTRAKEHIAALYGADLLGAALGAVAFVPLLLVFAGPDVVFVAMGACAVAGLVLYAADGNRGGLRVSLAVLAASLAAIVSATRADLLPIRKAAGYSEDQVVYTQWTPLTRLSIHRDARGDYMLLDNASASEIIQTEERRTALGRETNRTLVYELHDPPARVAILAASAGPEVGVAQARGFTDIDAIDIAGEIFDIVATRYAAAPINPYLQPGVRRVHADGRAAILRGTEPWDIIHMVHANLWSSAGLMSNAWSPTLLETREAFSTYLDHLSPDGTISFGRGVQSDDLYRAAVASLRDRGVEQPWRCVAYVGGFSRVVLVKKRPWTEAEGARLQSALKRFPGAKLLVDPMATAPSAEQKAIVRARAAQTDDHPWTDTPALVASSLRGAMKAAKGEATEPLTALYRSIVLQIGFVLAAGGLFVGLPILLRGRSEIRGITGAGPALLYVACLGYGYLAVETVLIHALVLFVGHPTYAVTTVVLAMLASSGLGATWASRPRPEHLARTLRIALGAVVVLGAIQAWIVPPLLTTYALAWSLEARLLVTGLSLAPLGFAMGLGFPIGIRLLPASSGSLVPWAWALNGWMSVVASLATLLLARTEGYRVAFGVALAAYAVALLLVGRLARVRAKSEGVKAA